MRSMMLAGLFCLMLSAVATWGQASVTDSSDALPEAGREAGQLTVTDPATEKAHASTKTYTALAIVVAVVAGAAAVVVSRKPRA